MKDIIIKLKEIVDEFDKLECRDCLNCDYFNICCFIDDELSPQLLKYDERGLNKE